MTNIEVLAKAVEKAKANGWKGVENLFQQTKSHYGWQEVKDPMIASSNDLIFNQGFAKSIWGDKEMIAYQFHSALARESSDLLESGAYYIWQYHLQQMVISDDPIKYLGENLNL